MRRLDQRGVAALEFCLVFVPLCLTLFAVFDLGRYAITLQSLRMLANAGARTIMINCYTNAVILKNAPTTCSGDPLPTDAAKQAVAPFLYAGGLTPTLSAPAVTSSPIVVTASSPNFQMMMPIWGTTLNAPSVTTQIPF
ncbi:TadE/TadG family type IV pilus assembly protein [Bradyrhizobium viridifuturi]|uniref:TadE/TadG family type IV pilus assembly protein n=1 Tax=Bradyrhizobium viridifuturi TaxID=1654716 RepID=UPI000A789993|nr:TadE family protein [Bradyrhizobium viridifuturi]